MDRNEAIEHLKVVLKTCDVQDEEAVEMAIKALEKEAEHQAKLAEIKSRFKDCYYNKGYEQGKADALKWIPVTPDTMPEENKVVVVCGEKGTWDYGTYRGHLNSVNNWNWKKNTVKTVYWWMYKEDALPMPWKGEAD